MGSRYWFKMYVEIIDDPKIGMLDYELRWLFVECCALATRVNNDGELPDMTTMCWALRKDEAKLLSQLHTLEKAGVVEKIKDGDREYWNVVSYAKRQAPMTAKERMSRMRETKRKDEYYAAGDNGVTKGNTELEKEIELDDSQLTTFRMLYDAFYTKAKLPLNPNPKPSQVETVKNWVVGGVISDDIERAIKYNLGEGLPVVAPSNINTGVFIERNKREAPRMSTADKLREAGFDG